MSTGIDLASSGVKAVRLDPKTRNLRAAVFIPRGERPEEDAEPFVNLPSDFDKILASAGCASNPVVSITGQDVMVRVLVTPPMDEKEIDRHVRVEMLDKIAGEGDKFAVDFHNVSISPMFISRRVVTFAAAMRESVLDKRFSAWVKAGVRPDCLTPACEALYHAFRHANPLHEGTSVVVDIGADHAEMAVVRDGDMLMARMLPVGGDKVTGTLAKRLGMTREKAERYKRERARVQFDNRGLEKSMLQINAALRENVEGLANLLNNAVSFIRRELRKKQLEFDEIVITGGGSRLKGLKEYLETKFKKPAREWNPAESLNTTGASPETLAVLEKHGRSMAVAVGLALVSASEEAFAARLVPPSVAASRNFRRRTAWGIGAGILTAAAAALLVTRFATAKNAAEQKLKSFREKQTVFMQEKSAVQRQRKLTDHAAWLADQYASRGEAGRKFIEAYLAITELSRELFPNGRIRLVSIEMPRPDEAEQESGNETLRREILVAMELAKPAGLTAVAAGKLSLGDLDKLEEMKRRLKENQLFEEGVSFEHDDEGASFKIAWRLAVAEKAGAVVTPEETL